MFPQAAISYVKDFNCHSGTTIGFRLFGFCRYSFRYCIRPLKQSRPQEFSNACNDLKDVLLKMPGTFMTHTETGQLELDFLLNTASESFFVDSMFQSCSRWTQATHDFAWSQQLRASNLLIVEHTWVLAIHVQASKISKKGKPAPKASKDKSQVGVHDKASLFLFRTLVSGTCWEAVSYTHLTLPTKLEV